MRTSMTYPTDRMITYACDLLDKKDLMYHDGYRAALASKNMSEGEYIAHMQKMIREGHVSFERCKQILDTLTKLPNKSDAHPNVVAAFRQSWAPALRAQPDGEERAFLYMMKSGAQPVPRGSYAVPTSLLPGTYTNETNFYSVWIKDLDAHQVNITPGEHPWTVRQYLSDERVKIVRATQYRVLDILTTDPSGFAAMYGHMIGKCGICGRKLTNDVSRDRGIGPICAERWGW